MQTKDSTYYDIYYLIEWSPVSLTTADNFETVLNNMV